MMVKLLPGYVSQASTILVSKLESKKGGQVWQFART
jgi:hypothetical protein